MSSELSETLVKQAVDTRPAIVLLKTFEPIEQHGVCVKAGTEGTLIRLWTSDVVDDAALVELPGLDDWYWIPASWVSLEAAKTNYQPADRTSEE